MRGLFFKIFVIFWIAQSLIFVMSTALILRRRIPDPDILFGSLYSFLHIEAKESVAAFESGGCNAFMFYGNARAESISLADDKGREICGVDARISSNPENTPMDRIVGMQVPNRYLWRVPTISKSGRNYTFILSRPHVPFGSNRYPGWVRFAFPQMPVAIAVGGATTFVLVLLFTRPLVKLRKAARALAEGKLSTRVGENSPHSQPFKGDEFNGLIHDFNNMADRLESLVDAQKLLLRDVSHELRSPLARLSVALELAREDADPDLSMDAHLNRIEREAEKLNQLIGQLLTLSSMEAIQNVDNFHPVSLTNVIEQLLPDAAYEAQQRNCSVDFTATAECVVNGNHDLLYRALENVVRNAIRYSKPGSKVEIQLAAILEEGRELAVLEVNDSGPGIPEVAIRSIFRPFYRVDHARSPETGGFGVGLAITDRAVKLHHGQIQAFNKPGGGTKVRMTLPLIANESKPGMISAW